jgi:cytochrome b
VLMNKPLKSNEHTPAKKLVWDIPVRLFHWALAGSFVLAWLTRGDTYLDVHVFFGYLMAGLVAFRILWGVWGGRHARFQDFAYTWAEVRGYLKALMSARGTPYTGHNPPGSWGIYTMLVLVALVAATGVMTLGGEERQGPIAGWLTFSWGEASHLIHALLAWAMLGVVVLHLVGVVVASIAHGQNLVLAMLTGYKRTAHGQGAAAAHSLVGAALLTVSLGGSAYYFRGYLHHSLEQPYLPFVGPPLPDNKIWREECGTCHLAFHPTLLPARSWQTLMAQQANHFGENLFLQTHVVKLVTEFLTRNAAENSLSEPAWKISRLTPSGMTPLRITETRYWQEKHQSIAARAWASPRIGGKSDCAVCHLDADKGTFQDGAISVPN